MLRWRLILGTLFIAALVGLFWADAHGVAGRHYPGMLLVPLALLLTVGATQEYLSMVRSREPGVACVPIYFGNIALVATTACGAPRLPIVALAAAFLIVVTVEIFRYDKDVSQRVTERLGLSVLGLVYVGVLMSFIVGLRMLPQGIFPLISMLVVVKMADIGAYTVGRLIGKHKLAPKLSPGKTIEGLAGGIVFSILGGFGAAWLFSGGFGEGKSWLSLAVYAIVVGLTGTLGDLAESLLKRDFGRKDSSTWMPGFGGVLDLIDSPLLAAPVAWAFWHWGWLAS